MDARKLNGRAAERVMVNICSTSLRLRDKGGKFACIEDSLKKARTYSYRTRATMRAARRRQSKAWTNRTL